MMQQNFSRLAGNSRAWLDELPGWAALHPVGTVDGYWSWATPPNPATRRAAAWGYKIGFGASGRYGVLGARFEPHEYSFLRVAVPATTSTAGPAEEPFSAGRVGLPHEYVGGVLAGALQEAERLGPGTLRFTCAAVHHVDSSWEAFRICAVGVVRLLGLANADEVPSDLLPYFGDEAPPPPGMT